MLKLLIQEILSAGLSQTDIGKRINYPQSRISDIVNDKQLTAPYEVGKRIEALHSELIKQ
jgi:plasmid maintenance system antidote protein VapI